MKTLRIGIIGAGGIVRQRHLPGLKKLPGVEIAAVANSTKESAAAFCAEHAPGAQAVGRWEDLVAMPGLDIIWIGAAPNLHKPTVLASLAAGRHTFCQARMAMNLDDAEEMLAAAMARPDLVTMLCPPPQGLRGDAYFRELLGQKIVGEPRTIRLQSFNGAFRDPSAPAHWRQRTEISGRNILSLGIHTEVLQRWFGDFAVTHAQGTTFTPSRCGYTVRVPDVLQVLARFENGAAATLEFSGIASGDPVERLEVNGTEGVLVYDYVKDEIRVQRPGAAWEVLPVPDPLARDWQVEADFLAAVRDPAAPRPHPDFHDGVRYMRVVQAVGGLLAGEQA